MHGSVRCPTQISSFVSTKWSRADYSQVVQILLHYSFLLGLPRLPFPSMIPSITLLIFLLSSILQIDQVSYSLLSASDLPQYLAFFDLPTCNLHCTILGVIFFYNSTFRRPKSYPISLFDCLKSIQGCAKYAYLIKHLIWSCNLFACNSISYH